MAQYKRMTQLETAEVVSLLRQNLRVVDPDRRIVEYVPGWSDGEVAARACVQAPSVCALRQKHFGRLNERARPEPSPQQSDRMERLEGGIAEILKEISDMRAELRSLREARPEKATLFEFVERAGNGK